jgi:hypothetical protein
MVSTVNASFIQNGTFETLDPGSPVFASWSNGGSVTAAVVPISGAYSAKLIRNSGGYLQQHPSTPQPVFAVELDLALSDPGSSTDRSFQMNLLHTSTTIGSGNYHNINMRVVRGSAAGVGTVQVYNQTTTSWVNALTDAVTFSANENTLSVNHVIFSGNYGDGSPAYNISVKDSGGTTRTALELTLWQGTPPTATGDNLTSVRFDNTNIVTGSWCVVDNINVTQAPSAQAPSPANGVANQNASGLFLTWQRGDDPNHLGQPNPAVTGYYVYIDQYDVVSDPGEPNFTGMTPISLGGTQYPASSPPMAYGIDQVVYWRVDESINGSSATDANSITGNTWYFTTTSSSPDIITQPQDVEISEGQTAVFTIEAGGIYPITSYNWYNSDDVLVGSDATLTIPDAAIEDSDSFYCVVTNNQGKTSQSDSVSLYVKGLLAQYSFQNNLEDSAGDNNGTAKNIDPNATPSVSYIAGASGQAVQLSGGNYVELSSTGYPNSVMGLARGTISCWVKTTIAGTNTIIASYNDGLTTACNLAIRDPNTVYLFIRAEGDVVTQIQTTATGVKDGQWHHIAASYALGSQTIAYFDGEQIASAGGISTAAAFLPWTYSLPIGAANVRSVVKEMFNGGIDDLVIYNYVKTNKEILDMYNAIAEPDKSLCLNEYASAYDLAGPAGVGTEHADCKVNLLDFAAMAASWLDCGLYPESGCL